MVIFLKKLSLIIGVLTLTLSKRQRENTAATAFSCCLATEILS